MIATQTVLGPIKYHGGKTRRARLTHLHYVEPYFGGGAVLFAKDPTGVSEGVSGITERVVELREYR